MHLLNSIGTIGGQQSGFSQTSVNLKLRLPPIAINKFLEYHRTYKIDQIIPAQDLPGISTIVYQVIDRDQSGPLGDSYYNKVFERTVHDSTGISDAQMLQWGGEAALNALETDNVAGREWVGTASNGMTFRGYFDKSGNVIGFFPQI